MKVPEGDSKKNSKEDSVEKPVGRSKESTQGLTGAGENRSSYHLNVKSYLDLTDPSAAREEGKFVILTKGKNLHLVLSPVALTPYHANIVYQYLQVEGRGQVEAVSSSGCRILTKGWHVKGGGYYNVQTWLHTLTLLGKSTAFGKYEAEVLKPFLEEIPGLLGLPSYFLELK